MSDAVSWVLIAVVILLVQASEGPASETAPVEAQRREGETPTPRKTVGYPFQFDNYAAIARAIVAAGAVMAVILGLLEMAGANGGTTSASVDRNGQLISGALQVAAGGLSLLLFYTGTSRIPGLRRLRPGAPISWLAILLTFESFAANLSTGTGTSGQPSGTPGVHPASGPTARDLMIGEIPFLLVAVASVGPVVRRTLRQTAERLGLWPLRLPWWGIGIAVGVVLVPVGGFVVDLLNHLATASCIAQNGQAEQATVGVGRTTLEQIGVAVAAGVGEEILFRGALQPRVGILISSLVWASYHVQYICGGFPPANLYLVLLGLVFGLLRKWGGLWPAILAHAAYDGVILLHLLGT